MDRNELKLILTKARRQNQRVHEIALHGELGNWELDKTNDIYKAQVRIFLRGRREDGVDVDVSTGEACSEPITRELGIPAIINGPRYRYLWRKADQELIRTQKRVAVRKACFEAVGVLAGLGNELSARVGGPVEILIVDNPDRVVDGPEAPAPGGAASSDPPAAQVP